MGNYSPGKFRRQGREAFEPGTDPDMLCPYKIGANFYAESNRADWMEGWKEAEQHYVPDDTFISESKPQHCPGIVFRASVSHYITDRGLGFHVRLNRAKRLSCPGCKNCQYNYDVLGEIGNDWPVLGIESVQSGKYYTIQTCNISTDFESGIVDSWDLKLVEYKPPL